jgi:type IV secretory pathway protease TraF
VIVRAAFTAACCCVPLLLAPIVGAAPLVYRNIGSSMPHGWYVRVYFGKVQPGAVVVRKDPPGFKLRWLMKRVEAVGGDRFCWREDLGTHTIGERVMPPPSPEAAALNIAVWHGCRVLGRDEIVGYGQSSDSWDSRYFGPVTIDQIWGIYRPLWIESDPR